MPAETRDVLAPAEIAELPRRARHELVEILAQVCAELFDAHRELAEARGAELETRLAGYARSEGESHAARERQGQAEAIPYTLDVLKLEAHVRSLDLLRELCEFLIMGDHL